MNKKIILFILFICTSVASIYAATISNPKNFIMNTMKKYSPTGYHILKKTAEAPGKYETPDYTINMGSADFMMYIDSREETGLVHKVNLIVHEMCHDYTKRMVPFVSGKATGDITDYFAFYVGAKETVLVKKTKIFITNKMASSFPKDLRTFRFNDYINNTSEYLGSQVNGVYGLLDEYNAYYHGTKSTTDMYPYFKNKMPQTRKTWEKYIENIGDSLLGCYEFKLYTLKYILYAEKRYPHIYKKIVSNKQFKKVFTKIDKNVDGLIKTYNKNILNICTILKGRGLDSKISDGTLYIGSSQIEVFVNQRKRLIKELGKKEYRSIIAILGK